MYLTMITLYLVDSSKQINTDFVTHEDEITETVSVVQQWQDIEAAALQYGSYLFY